MHAAEHLQEITISEAAIFLGAVLSDVHQLLLAKNLKLLRHHGLAAAEFLV